MGQRELTAAREVLGAVRGERLHKVQEQGEQALIKLGRSRRFFGASSVSSFHYPSITTGPWDALIRLWLKSTGLPAAPSCGGWSAIPNGLWSSPCVPSLQRISRTRTSHCIAEILQSRIPVVVARLGATGGDAGFGIVL